MEICKPQQLWYRSSNSVDFPESNLLEVSYKNEMGEELEYMSTD